MDPAQLGRIVAQHAETSRLMGVDFVPSFRKPGGDAVPAVSSEAPPRENVIVEPAPAPRTATPPAALLQDARLPDALPLTPAPDTPAMVERPRTRERGEVQRSLDLLRAKYEADAPHQHFKTDHHRIVFGDGDPCARLVFVGEAPGEEEDRQGIPFVGRAGQLLNKMIQAMGLSRDQVYICNVLKTRPPNNATPTHEESRLCAPYLFEQLRIINPEVIVTLGLPAAKTLLNTEDTMARLRARWHDFVFGGPPIPLIATYHPAFLLRAYTPENRHKVWSDLQMAMERIGLKPAKAAQIGPA